MQFLAYNENLQRMLTGTRSVAESIWSFTKMLRGRALLASPLQLKFRGAYKSYKEAFDAVPANHIAGYNHRSVADISFDVMCRVAPWDYPVLYWLQRLLPGATRLLDAGGHMGTKFRAFQNHLPLGAPLEWFVYDVPEIVAEGRRRAAAQDLQGLFFIDDLSAIAPVDILLASGLFQYLDMPLTEFIRGLAVMPEHIIINKLALREGDTIVTLENFGEAMVPYQIRSRRPFFAELEKLGYRVVDEWSIPSLSHTIPTHPELGASQSIGCYLRLYHASHEQYTAACG